MDIWEWFVKQNFPEGTMVGFEYSEQFNEVRVYKKDVGSKHWKLEARLEWDRKAVGDDFKGACS